MAFVPILMAASAAMGVIGGGVKAYGQMYQGHAEANAANYNAQVAKENAAVANQNATMVMQAGEAQTGIAQEQARGQYGDIKANQAASGLDVNMGSSVAARASEREIADLDAMTIRSNAAKEAYGYQVQEKNLEAESYLQHKEAEYDIEGANIGALGTFLGSLGGAGGQYGNYLMNSGLAT